MIVQSGQYAIVDPESPSSILYLTKKEYLKLVGIAESNDSKLTLLASPYDARPNEEKIEAPKPENSPPTRQVGTAIFWSGMLSRISRSYRAFLSPGSKMFDTKKLGNLLPGLVKRWSLALGQWAGLPLTTQSWYKDINHILPHLVSVYKTQGTKGLVLRLKHSSLLICQYLAGTPANSHAFGHPVKVTHGLPSWLPHHARLAIRQRCKRVIRFWLSILYIYKVIEMPHKVIDALVTVQQAPLVETPMVLLLLSTYRTFLREVFVPSFLKGALPMPKFKKKTFFCPISAGPNGAPAINRAAEDCAGLYLEHVESKRDPASPRPSILENICSLIELFGYRQKSSWILDIGKARVAKYDQEMLEATTPKKEPKPLRHSRVHVLGEPAGKLRPIAIFDLFSQRALKPFHDEIFLKLRKIRQDGTHSQTKLMTWLKGVASQRWQKVTWSSLDISAATDSIPVQLLRILIVECFGGSEKAETMADLVLSILTGREFDVTVDKSVVAPAAQSNALPAKVRYTRGQPMGALGSFALLALWNHSWVQFASWLVTGRCIHDYGVTGDDVVISEPHTHSPIGKKYVEISERFGIRISLSKSFLSSTLFNFLSRTWMDGEEVSPASMREDIHVRDASTRTQRALRLLDRDWWNVSGNGWLVKAMKHFLYPSELLVSCAFARRGKLDGYGVRSILSFLSPSRSVSAAVGLSGVPIYGWLSAFAGSTALLAHGHLVRTDSLLPRGVRREDSSTMLQSLLATICKKISETYLVNELRAAEYRGWLKANVRYAFTDFRIQDLFLPDYDSFDRSHRSLATPSLLDFSSGMEAWGAYESVDWSTPVYNETPDNASGYTYHELLDKFAPSTTAPQDIKNMIGKSLDWLNDVEKLYDFKDPDLFDHQATLWYSKRALGEREFNQSERTMLSLLYSFSQYYPGDVDLEINSKMATFLERKFLDSHLGFAF
jgi:hypothetical protein